MLPGRFDHLVAIERAGRAADGNYYNARKMNIKHLVDPIDDLFLVAQKIPGISSTGKQEAPGIQNVSALNAFLLTTEHRTGKSSVGTIVSHSREGLYRQ